MSLRDEELAGWGMCYQGWWTCGQIRRIFAPPAPFIKKVWCVREADILEEHRHPQRVMVCDHVSLEINKCSGCTERDEEWVVKYWGLRNVLKGFGRCAERVACCAIRVGGCMCWQENKVFYRNRGACESRATGEWEVCCQGKKIY